MTLSVCATTYRDSGHCVTVNLITTRGRKTTVLLLWVTDDSFRPTGHPRLVFGPSRLPGTSGLLSSYCVESSRPTEVEVGCREKDGVVLVVRDTRHLDRGTGDLFLK